MFNICEKTEMVGFERMKIGHIQHVINSDKNKNVKYSYFGKRVQRGTMQLHTKYGVLNVKFDVECGWARRLEVVA